MLPAIGIESPCETIAGRSSEQRSGWQLCVTGALIGLEASFSGRRLINESGAAESGTSKRATLTCRPLGSTRPRPTGFNG